MNLTIKFIRSRAPYNTGDTATFPKAKAQEFIRKGYAVRADGTSPAEDEAPAAAPAPAGNVVNEEDVFGPDPAPAEEPKPKKKSSKKRTRV